MKHPRWTALALALLGAFTCASASAGQSIALDEIGVRYTPAAGERCLTRADMPADALDALGTEAATLAAAMEADGLYLIGLQADGRQITLSVEAAPAGLAATDAQAMSAAEKDAFLSQMARRGGYGSAVWQEGGYALFSSTPQAGADQPLAYSDVMLATLYLGRVYALRMDVIGREPSENDVALLLDASARMLRLGACAAEPGAPETTEAPLTLPDTQVSSQPAVLAYGARDLPLSLDPVADTVGVTRVTLSGITAPNGYLRYSLNGKASSRIRADEAGAFRFAVPSLAADATNAVELTAFQGDAKTVVSFTVTVDWQVTPLALSAARSAQGDTLVLQGLTLPGASVKLTHGRAARVAVGEDGAFTLSLSLPRLGENAFTLQAQAEGYHRYDLNFAVTRTQSAAETLNALRKAAKATVYAKLAAKPAAYEGRVLALSGMADALRYVDGQASFVLADADGNLYAVLCADLLGVQEGGQVSLLGTLTGGVYGGDGLPALSLGAYEP